MSPRTPKQLWAEPQVAGARQAFHDYLDACDAAIAAADTPAFDELNRLADRAQLGLATHLHGVLMLIDQGAGKPLTGSSEARQATGGAS